MSEVTVLIRVGVLSFRYVLCECCTLNETQLKLLLLLFVYSSIVSKVLHDPRRNEIATAQAHVAAEILILRPPLWWIFFSVDEHGAPHQISQKNTEQRSGQI